MENDRAKYFNEYMDSIFASSVRLTPEEFELGAVVYEAIYGRFMPASLAAAILDVGSGAGHFLHFLKKKGYVNYAGIDMSAQQVEFCKKNVSEKVQLADAFDYLKEKSGTFDLLCLNPKSSAKTKTKAELPPVLTFRL